MKKKSLGFLAACMALLMSLTGCGDTGSEETMAPVQEQAEEPMAETETESEDEGKEEEAEPESEPEEAEVLAYVEKNGLKFCDGTSVTLDGVRINPDDREDFDVIDSDWRIESITMEDSEDGKVITVKQKVSGYIWGNEDGTVLKTDITMPGGLFCDTYTGTVIPTANMTEDMETAYETEIEWDGKTYSIKREESAKWEDGEWEPDPEGEGNVLHSTLCITDILTVSEGYDGLALILTPITEPPTEEVLAKAGVIEEKETLILDVLKDDGYLFSIAKAYESLNMADKGADTPEQSASTHTEEPKQNTPDSVHKHDYASAVTKEPCCGETGVKTFTCSCGDSYTESIPALGHQWVAQTETIEHPSQGHMESQEVKRSILGCWGCDATFETVDEMMDHEYSYVNWDAIDNADSIDGIFAAMTATPNEHGHLITEYYETVNNWVVDSEAWTETVTYNVCSVCGAKQ